jgi:hypothetical protein
MLLLLIVAMERLRARTYTSLRIWLPRWMASLWLPLDLGLVLGLRMELGPWVKMRRLSGEWAIIIV